MNETQQRPDQDGRDDGFDAHRLRTITDMRRSRDDRVVAGVCAGAAKYLNVDPVVVRVVFAVLTFVGLSGLILYIAAWFFLPADDAEHSVAADWFNLDKNEEQVRIVGLVAAAVLAAAAIVGDNSWAWWGVPWILVPLGILYWFFIVRPGRHDGGVSPEPHEPAAAASPGDAETTAVLPAGTSIDPTSDSTARPESAAKKRGASALTVLTLSVAAIAVAVTVLIAEADDGAAWTTYVAVALGVVVLGLLVGTFFGRPGPLIVVGFILAAVLVVGSLVPSAGTGERRITPSTAAGVEGRYEHGLGVLDLDLTEVRDAEQLLGSTIEVENGAGEITVTVPDDLNVAVDAEVGAGEIRAFGRKSNGTDAELVEPAEAGPALTVRIRQTFGGIEVIER